MLPYRLETFGSANYLDKLFLEEEKKAISYENYTEFCAFKHCSCVCTDKSWTVEHTVSTSANKKEVKRQTWLLMIYYLMQITFPAGNMNILTSKFK